MCHFLRYVTVMIGMMVLAGSLRADPFPDRVTDVMYGEGAGFGQESFPEIVLGPPHGAGENAGSLDVLSLGNGGIITLEFTDNTPENGPGPDLIVFENSFYVAQNPENVFCEVAFVEVSQDGEIFYRFPNDYDPAGEPVNNPVNWQGFAGVYPVLSHPENGIDPTDPGMAGGDVFELDDVGLDWIRFIRIVDTDEPPDAAYDDNGDEIYDPAAGTGTTGGFDLDAVAAVYPGEHATPTPDPTETTVPTNTPSPSPSPESTPTPDAWRLDLILPETSPEAGDEFSVTVDIWNPGETVSSAYLLVALDIQGLFFFHPGWTLELNAEPLTLPPGPVSRDILRFTWPETDAHADKPGFWAVLLDVSGQLIGNHDYASFSF